MAGEEFRVALGIELRSNELDSIRNQINNIQVNPITLTINDRDVQNQINSIRNQIQNLSNIRINLNGGNGGNGGRGNNVINNTTLAYRELLRIIREIGSVRVRLNGLDSNRDASQIATLTNQLNTLQRSYDNIRLTFDQRFNVGQLVGLQEALQRVANSVDVVDAKMADANSRMVNTEAVRQVEAAYNDLMILQKRINSIRIQIGGLDSAKNSMQITELSGQLNRLMADYNNLYQTFRYEFSTDQLDNLSRSFEVATGKVQALNAKMSDTEAIRQTEVAYKELYSIAKQIDNFELKIGSLDGKANANEIAELTSQLNSLRQTYQQLSTSLQGQLSPTQLSNLGTMVYDTQDKLRQLDAKIADTKAKLANSINLKFDDGTFNNDVSKLETSLSKIRNQSAEVVSSMQAFQFALQDMDIARNNNDVDALIGSYERYKNALRDVQNQIEINTRAEKQQNDISKLNNDRIAFASKIDIWLTKNSAATKQFGGEIDALKARLQGCDRVELDHLKAKFTDIQKRAEMAGKATMTFSDRFNMQMKKLSSYFSAATLIAYSARAVTDMYDNVVAVDTAMTGLYRVTDLTAQQYDELYNNMITSAKEYGSTLSDIINATADWVRLGFDASTANKLTEITAMYQHISDLDNETAVENLVTAYKGFQDQLLNLYNGDEVAAIGYIADILNELDNNFAVTADDIGAALTKSASALELAGNTIQETAAMVTGITEVTQDPEKAGSALKILSLRLRGMKGELEELGEEVDENVESISKMQTQVLNFTGGKVNIFNDDGSFKSTYEIMSAIADVYEKLSSTDQADLLETIAGKNRANDVAALLSNWKQVEAAMKSATEAEGSAAEENEKYMDSIKGRLDALTASWQAFSNTFINSDFVKVLITGLTEVVDVLDFIVDKFGTINTIIAGAAIGKFISGITSASKAVGGLSRLSDITSLLSIAFPNAAKGIGVFSSALSNGASIAGIAKAAISGLWTVISAHPIAAAIGAVALLVVTFDKLHTSAKEANEKMENAFGEYEDAKQKVIDVNNELEKTQTRMAELQSKGGLTFVEQSELDKLEKATELLLIQADIAKKEEQKEAKEAAESAVDAYEKNYKVEISAEKTKEYQDNAKLTGNNAILFSNEKDVSAMIAGIKQMEDLRDGLDKSSDTYADDYQQYTENINDATDSVWEQVDALIGYKEKLESIPFENLTNEQKKALQEISNSIEYVYKELDPNAWNQIQFDKVIDTKSLSDIKQELINMATEANRLITKDDLKKDEYLELADAAMKAGFSIQDLLNNLNSEVQIIEKAASSATDIAENLNISFSDLFGEDSEFESKVDDYIDKVSTLKEALTDYQNGDFSNDDLVKLTKQFHELAGDTDNLDVAIVNLLGDLNSDMLAEFSSQFGNLNTDEDIAALKNFQNAVLELGSVVGNTQMSIDIEAESEGMENLVTAMEESVSSTGLTSESINNLKERYKELEAKGHDVDKVFEETTNGIHLNGEALRELESEYVKYKKSIIDTDLKGLVNEYNSLTEQINNCSYATKTAELYAKRDDILNQINETATLAAQYEGLTSAYHKWEMAQAGGNERDMYEGVIKGKEEIEEEMSRGWLDDDTRAYLELLSGKDLSTAKYDELLSVYKELGKAVNNSGYSVYDFFTKNKDGDSTTNGIFNFFDAVKAEQEKLGEEWVKINKDGTYSFDFGVNGDEAVAEALGISEELVQIILRAASDAGFDVNLDSAYSELADFEDKSKEVNDKLKELGATEYTFNINSTNIDDLETQIAEAKIALSNLKNEDGTLRVGVSEEDYQNAQTMIAALVYQKQKLDKSAILSVDTENANSEIETTIGKLQEFKSYSNTLEVEAAVGADTTEAQTNIQAVLTDIDSIPDDIKTKLGLDDTEFQTALTNLINTEVDVEAGVNLSETDLATINSTISAITPEMMVECGLDATLIEEYQAAEHTTDGTVIWNNNIDKVTSWINENHEAKGWVLWDDDTSRLKTTYTGTGYITWNAAPKVDGTAHSNGTAYVSGTAYSRGNWGTKESGIALGGELGQELVSYIAR